MKLFKFNLHEVLFRTPHIFMVLVMAFLTALLTGCTSAKTEQGITQDSSKINETTVTDSSQISSDKTTDSTLSVSSGTSGTEDTVCADTCPKSVVAVSKSIAELWLLSGGTLSGTTEDAMELDGITEDTAVIGTLSRPNNEAILALSPELVLMTLDIPAQKELKTELDGMGIPTKAIEISSFEDYETCINELTDLTGRKDLYEQNAVQVGERIEAICSEIKETADANASEGKTFLAMRVSATKNKVFKDDYFACEIFRDFGLINIAEGNTNLDELNLEAIVAANPDYIFVIPQGRESEAMESYKAQFEDNPVWSELDAVKEGRLFVMPKDYFQYKPNAQWDLAYEYVRDLIAEQ